MLAQTTRSSVPAMTIEELIARLEYLARRDSSSEDRNHRDADAALLRYINDRRVTAAWKRIEKWFA